MMMKSYWQHSGGLSELSTFVFSWVLESWGHDSFFFGSITFSKLNKWNLIVKIFYAYNLTNNYVYFNFIETLSTFFLSFFTFWNILIPELQHCFQINKNLDHATTILATLWDVQLYS